jgi:hypothetical protein
VPGTGLAAALDQDRVNERAAPEPLQGVTVLLEECGVPFSRLQNPFFAIMENVNVAREAGRVAVQRRTSRHVTFRVAVRGKKPENVALNLRERHGTPAQSLPQGAALADYLQPAGYA